MSIRSPFWRLFAESKIEYPNTLKILWECSTKCWFDNRGNSERIMSRNVHVSVWFGSNDGKKLVMCNFSTIFINKHHFRVCEDSWIYFISIDYIKLSEKFLSFYNEIIDAIYRIMHEHNNRNRTKYLIQWNNIKQKLLFIYYHLMIRKKLFGQPNI